MLVYMFVHRGSLPRLSLAELWVNAEGETTYIKR